MIALQYPYLENLDIQILIEWYKGFFTEDVAERLINKNSNIRSLILRRASPKLWKIAADSLSNLEIFEIDRYNSLNYTGESIHYNSVKAFKVNEFSLIHTNITFGCLEEFESDEILYSKMERWLQFIEKNKCLKKIQIDTQNIKLRNVDITQLARVTGRLQEASISFAKDIKVESILKLIESNEELKKFRLNILNALYYKISNNWNISESSNIIFLENKRENKY